VDWLNDRAPRHEGYLVGIRTVTTEGGSTKFRELENADDDGREHPLSIVQVGCDCGWRSSRLKAPYGTRWMGRVELPRDEQERETASARKPFETTCRELWREHAVGSTEAGLALADE
jgi:hypothetical protein